MYPEDLKNKTIILAPLDWGMGHLTRCLPLVRLFLKNNCKVILAGTAFQCDWMKKECPRVVTEEVSGFQIQLDPSKSTYWQMLIQSSKMLNAIRNEHKAAKQLAEKYAADFIISDNRYGFRSQKTYNIFITHQLSPPVPKLRTIITKKIVRWVNQFDECWIQDHKKSPLCPELNQTDLRISKSFIGWSSRFAKIEQPLKNKFCFIASGPEPQLSKFSKVVADLLEKSGKEYQLITPIDLRLKNQIINPTTDELNVIINTSEIIISRAGYTSIMELCAIDKKAILIPTPGQFEQLYLAKSIHHPQIQFVQEKDLGQLFTAFKDL